MTAHRQINWDEKIEYAHRLTDAELDFARRDARKTSELWEAAYRRDRDDGDPEGLGALYRDEATVYAAEQARRKRARS